MKPKKFTLEWDDAEDFQVLAICSHEPDYKLVWTINKRAGLELIRCEDYHLCPAMKGDYASEHVQFRYFDELNQVHYVLIKNRNNKHFLVPELEKIDYFLFLSTANQYPTNTIKRALSEEQSIIAVYKIEPEHIKSISRLSVFG
jgi:formate-dependent phosphoribosylglycinamide formyltransferase (GAR transformylase)